jgi:hypothetical protein
MSWPNSTENNFCLVTQHFPYMLFILGVITRVYTIHKRRTKILTHWGHSNKQEDFCIPTLNRTRDVQVILF